MNKFKVGDLVRGNNTRYGITNNDMLIGVVTGVYDNNTISVFCIIHKYSEYGNFLELDSEEFELVDSHSPIVSKFLNLYYNYLFDYTKCYKYNISLKDIIEMCYGVDPSDFMRCLNQLRYLSVNNVLSKLSELGVFSYKRL